MTNENSRVVDVGGVKIGGDNPIVVQSMTNTDTRDPDATIDQIRRLVGHGCELVRVAVPDDEAARSLSRIIAESPVPIIADIHYSPDLALMALDAGVAKLRLNPGNITLDRDIRRIADAASEKSIPIRVGVNSGSLDQEIIDEYGRTAAGMVASAEREIRLLEGQGFEDIVVSLKSSEVNMTVESNRIFAEKYDYPLHLGVTEAGGGRSGLVKSAIGIGTLLGEGIGDTVRISLTADPVEEVGAAYDILRALDLRNRGIDIVSCPTCGRTEIDVQGLGGYLERNMGDVTGSIRVALMGCSVNGIGEAGSSNVGVVGTENGGLLYVDGEYKETIGADDTDVMAEKIEESVRDYLGRGG
ncbi:MAG: flavodoxin-dependent (E)-4-hydroxy-3-methylbut-2-enyl-diphosphate synthase [Candidatus Acetothermia bacterium]